MTVGLEAQAEQYRSEVKEIPGYKEPAKQQAEKPEERLKKLGNNPYAKALTLQEMAGQAAKNKDYKKAMQYLEDALATGALSEIAEADMRKDLATLYVAGGQPAKAIGMLKQAVRGEGAKNADLHYALAAAYVGTKKYREALSPLKRAMELVQRPKASWYDLMFAIRHKLGQLSEAADVLQEKLDIYGADKEAWMQLTAIHVQNKRYDKAAATRAVAYRQGYLDSQEELLQLAGLYTRGGAPYEAAALMQQWLKSGKLPDEVRHWEHLAGLWLEAKEREKALSAMAKAAQKSGKASQYMAIAQLNMELENWRQAENAIGQAFQRGLSQKQSGDAYIALGWSQFQMGKEDSALASFAAAANHSDPKVKKLANQWLDFIRAGVKPTEVAQRNNDAGDGLVPEGEAYGGEAVTAVAIADLPQLARRSGDAGSTSGGGYETGDKYIPTGGIRAGSSDGRIPPWAGGLHPGNTQGNIRVNPYAK
ncbi:MAG: tetratricopeptide repeat protein, partial [Salinisphaeraceae bacterium]|nr:tetratricopeptide repeat protein [Salinisphaeraceae bacterium]